MKILILFAMMDIALFVITAVLIAQRTIRRTVRRFRPAVR